MMKTRYCDLGCRYIGNCHTYKTPPCEPKDFTVDGNSRTSDETQSTNQTMKSEEK